mmetsp:Transcript_67849/g.128139  ORF Transcript_67849/g.128139 Transcript_67849/m.128139 type:complete len:214 (+) Transcript_67849:3-644(+)
MDKQPADASLGPLLENPLALSARGLPGPGLRAGACNFGFGGARPTAVLPPRPLPSSPPGTLDTISSSPPGTMDALQMASATSAMSQSRNGSSALHSLNAHDPWQGKDVVQMAFELHPHLPPEEIMKMTLPMHPCRISPCNPVVSKATPVGRMHHTSDASPANATSLLRHFLPHSSASRLPSGDSTNSTATPHFGVPSPQETLVSRPSGWNGAN